MDIAFPLHVLIPMQCDRGNSEKINELGTRRTFAIRRPSKFSQAPQSYFFSPYRPPVEAISVPKDKATLFQLVTG
jgi:hypothetical protein